MLAPELGRQVKAERARLGLAQDALAKRAAVSRTVLSRLESGHEGPVQSDVMERIAKGLGLPIRVTIGVSSSQSEERLKLRLRQEGLRARHLRLALDLAMDPKRAKPMVEQARRQVRLWEERKSCSPRYIERWNKVLSLPPREMALAMASLGEWEDAMLQNSPWSFAWS
jgi:transcriptional regulator with XRE-family HTH domain